MFFLPKKYLKIIFFQLKVCANYNDNITYISGNTKNIVYQSTHDSSLQKTDENRKFALFTLENVLFRIEN
jgi:hypothetical protein